MAMIWWQSLLIISLGASLGASLRWLLGVLFNPLLATLSFGTLIANYLGSFVIGLLIAVCWQYPQFSTSWRLFLITGLLGSLTTFSAFSAEVIENLLQGYFLNATIVVLLHLVGALLFTALGVGIARYWIS